MAKVVAAPAEDTLSKFGIDTEILQESDLDKSIPEERTEKLTEAEAAALYEEAANIDAALEALTERKEQIKARFRLLDYGTPKVHASGGSVTVGHNPIFNEARFLTEKPYDYAEVQDSIVEDRFGRKKVTPVTVYPNRELYKITPDRPAIKRVLGEDAAKSFYDEGDKKITIR